jgi:ribulose-phosphate 3-epimerase
MIVSPSIASADPLRLAEEWKRVKEYSDLHIDIEDGHFIPNITFGLKTVQALRQLSDQPFSFHLMVDDPYAYFKNVAQYQPSIIFAHVEALDYIQDFITYGKSWGTKVGLAFNPKSPIDPYLYALDQADGVLIMTSEPDGRGQTFIPTMLTKCIQVKTMSKVPEIWVDGGIQHHHLNQISEANVTHVVMGREIFNSSSTIMEV